MYGVVTRPSPSLSHCSKGTCAGESGKELEEEGGVAFSVSATRSDSGGGGGGGGGCSPGGFVDSCFCTWMHEHRCSAERPLSPVSSIHHSAVLNVPGLSPQSHGIILAVHTVNI